MPESRFREWSGFFYARHDQKKPFEQSKVRKAYGFFYERGNSGNNNKYS